MRPGIHGDGHGIGRLITLGIIRRAAERVAIARHTIAPGVWQRDGFAFGSPCVAGTTVPTEAIASRFRAGDTIAALAADFRLTGEQVEAALRFELCEAALVLPYLQRRHEEAARGARGSTREALIGWRARADAFRDAALDIEQRRCRP